MKRYCVATILTLGVCGHALALNYLGPPTTQMRAGQWAVGASYSYSTQDLDLGEFDLENAHQDSVLGRVTVGLVTSRLEISGLAGVADIDQSEFDTGNQLQVGGAFRLTMWEGGDLDWGIVGQGTYLRAEETGTVLGSRTDYELGLGELQFGLGPCWRPNWGIVYGGAMLHWIMGSMDTTGLDDFDVREQSVLGAYLGGGFDLDRHWTLTAEIQATPDAFGWATAVQLRF